MNNTGLNMLNRTFLTESKEEPSSLPPICNVKRIEGASSYTKSRILDGEVLYQLLLDVDKAKQDVCSALRTGFGDIFVEHAAHINVQLPQKLYSEKYAEPAYNESIEDEYYSSYKAKLWFRGRGFKDIVPAEPAMIRPWYTMIAVLWQDKKVFGVRLYDWLYDTCADYDIHSVSEQVKNKTVKITNLDWLVDARHKQGAICCTQGDFADYTALDIAGQPKNAYHPLVLLGYSPELYNSQTAITFVDYLGNIIDAATYDLGVRESRMLDTLFAKLVLTRGVANAVILVPQKLYDRNDVFSKFTKAAECMSAEATKLVKTLELEPFQQNKNGSDTYQSVLGYFAYYCRANVYRRVEWQSVLDSTKNVLLSTLTTTYDEKNNTYIQVPYAGLHIGQYYDNDINPGKQMASRINYALSYKTTYYPLLTSDCKPRVFDNCGRELLVTECYDEKQFLRKGNQMSCNRFVSLEMCNVIYMARRSHLKAGTIRIQDNDENKMENLALYPYSSSYVMLYNPGVYVALSSSDGKGGALVGRYTRYRLDSERDMNVLNNKLNPAITAHLFIKNNNIVQAMANLLLNGISGEDYLKMDKPYYEEATFELLFTVPELTSFAVPEIYPRLLVSLFNEAQLLIQGSYTVLGYERNSHTASKLTLNTPTTVCCFQGRRNSVIDRLISGTVEYLDIEQAHWGTQEVLLPDTIQVLGSAIFKDSSIKRVKFPANLRYIATACFSNCENLTQVELPEGLEVIGAQAFAACIGIKELIIPASVKIIHSKAFSDCLGLQNIVILGNPLVADDAFMNCSPNIVSKVESCCDIYSATSGSVDITKRLQESVVLYN